MSSMDISLNDIAGYATERMAWKMMLDLSELEEGVSINNLIPHNIFVVDGDFKLRKDNVLMSDSNCRAFSAPECFAGKLQSPETSDVWTIGALAFYAITGVDVFEGKGGETQTKDTEIPRLSSVYVGSELSCLIRSCLNYLPENRPAKEFIRQQSQAALLRPAVPGNRLLSNTGKSYSRSLIKFWPEEMVTAIIACLFLLLPTDILAQVPEFDKTSIPGEMVSLVLRCTELRSSQNVGKVSREMDRDMNWTMMDELSLDKSGECTTIDVVDMFGLNDLGFSILKRHGGITNAGGRFRDGRDPLYKFSFIEITVKQGKTVNYNIGGREGRQVFAIVPFEKDAKYQASIPDGNSFSDDGVSYIQLKQGLKKYDTFKLTIKNLSGKNMAFVIINYNSRNNE